MINLIINQSKLESNMSNTFVDLLAWISQLISNHLPPIFFNMFWFWDWRATAPCVLAIRSAWVAVWPSCIVVWPLLVVVWPVCVAIRPSDCIEQNFLTSKHQFLFNMKIHALHIVTRCPRCQIISLTILMPRYMMYAKFIKTKFDHI
jgi:hypothetical protein